MKSVILLLYLLSDVVELRKTSPTSSFTHLNTTRHLRHARDNGVSCTLPPHPKYGRWIVINGEGKAGGTIRANSILEFHCKKGYKLSSKSPYRVCDKKWNSKKTPECLKLCPLIYSTPTTTVQCVDKRGTEIGCHEATEGSYLSYTCAPFYEAPFGYKTTFFCSDGDWNSPSPICQPICGRKVNDDTKPLIYGGKLEQVIEYPWIASIYKKENSEYINICGGSVLSQKLILTAAHCVTNDYGDTLPETNYLVAAGKLHSRYNDSRDPHAQYLNVSRIIVHPTYKGNSRRFLGDIAILVTKEPFVLNRLIQPVCFSDVKNINPQVGSIGVVAGFGAREGGEPSDELRTLEIPYKSEATCAKELPDDWGDRYNVIDKLCAGHFNKSMSICNGDSGNGLFFRNPDNNRYYVHGVVSLGHSDRGECNIQQNSLYTKVAFHYDFLDRQITKYYVKDCTLPPHPENGKWIAENSDKNPGDVVPSNTLLKINCNEDYKLSSDTSHVRCESSFMMPTCQRLCPELRLRSGIAYSCISKEGEAVNCNEAVDHTTLTYSCPLGYKIAEGLKNTGQCLNGTWDLLAPSCHLIEDTSTEHAEEPEPYIKVICVYDSKMFNNGVRPEDLDASLCTHVIYDSVGLSSDGNLRVKRSDSDNSSNGYRSIADMKKRNCALKVLLSVYGSGSKSSSEFPVVATDPVKRKAFVDSVTNFLETYGYDGLNVHWDSVLRNDEENYITLLREIKEAFDKRGWLLSASVVYSPVWLGYKPIALYDIVDWINVGSYGFYSEWSTYTGQNSALYPSSLDHDYERANYNFRASVSNWKSSQFRLDKISPTIAFFGWYFTLKSSGRHGLHAPIIGITDSDHMGAVNYSEICEKFGNWTRVWHSEQKNPYKFYNNKWIGYDDRNSVKLKPFGNRDRRWTMVPLPLMPTISLALYFCFQPAESRILNTAKFAMTQGLFGVTVYPVDGDDVFGRCGPKQILLKSVRAGLGEPVDSEHMKFC